MKKVERNKEAERMLSNMERLGGNRNDAKTQAAYRRFKAVPWYLRDKKNKEEKED